MLIGRLSWLRCLVYHQHQPSAFKSHPVPNSHLFSFSSSSSLLQSLALPRAPHTNIHLVFIVRVLWLQGLEVKEVEVGFECWLGEGEEEEAGKVEG